MSILSKIFRKQEAGKEVVSSDPRVEEAKNYFHGEEGYNCVQATLKIFQKEYGVSEEEFVKAKAYGGGRAEGGVCGAPYAIKMVDEDLYNKLEEDFQREAGSLRCSEIKKLNELSCRNCVAYTVKRALEIKGEIN